MTYLCITILLNENASREENLCVTVGMTKFFLENIYVTFIEDVSGIKTLLQGKKEKPMRERPFIAAIA